MSTYRNLWKEEKIVTFLSVHMAYFIAKYKRRRAESFLCFQIECNKSFITLPRLEYDGP
jgi:hypothetical protein